MIRGRIVSVLLVLQRVIAKTLFNVLSIFLVVFSIFSPYVANLSPAKADSTQVTPLFTCWEDTLSANIKVYFGYQNDNAAQITILLGVNNELLPAPTLSTLITIFDVGRHDKAFYVEIPKNSTITWHLTGLTAVSDLTTTSQCPATGIDPAAIAFINSPKYVQSDTQEVVAEIETYNTISRAEFFIDGDLSSPIIVNAKTSSLRPGFDLWRLTTSLTSGAHTISGRVFIQGYWFDMTGSGGAIAIDSQDASFSLPNTDIHIFKPTDNPVQIRAGDGFDKFKSVDITIFDGAVPLTFSIKRNQCDTSHAGDYISCNVEDSSSWSPLEEGSYTATAIAYSKAGNASPLITSMPFLIDATPPIVTSLSIENANSYNVYSSPIGVNAQVSDLTEGSGIKKVSFFITSPEDIDGTKTCIGNGSHLIEASGSFDSTKNAYFTSLDTSSLNGQYCVNAQAEDMAGNKSNTRSLLVEFDNIGLDAPIIAGWNVRSISNNLTQNPVDLPCDQNGVYIGQDKNSLNQVWSASSGKKVKYIRRVSADGGNSWNVLSSMVFTTPHMNGWYSFGNDEENSYLTSVMAFDDLNNNNLPDDSATFISAWSLSCKITFDKSSPVLTEFESIHSPSKNENLRYVFSLADNSFVFNGNGEDRFELTYNGPCMSKTTTAVNGNNSILFEPLVDGLYDNCSITVKDKAGNISNTLLILPFLVDNTPTILKEVTPIPSIGADNTPQYTFSSTEDEDFTLTFGGGCLSSTIALHPDSDKLITIELTQLTDNTYADCSIIATDLAGNISNTLKISSFTIDTIAPVVELTLSPSQQIVNNKILIQGKITDLHHGSYSLFIKSNSSSTPDLGQNIYTSVSGVYTFSTEFDTKNLKDGDYFIILYAKDLAGNMSIEKRIDISIDNTGPSVTPFKNTTVNEGGIFAFNLKAFDPHGTSLTIQFKYTDPSDISTQWLDWGTMPGYPVNSKGDYEFFPGMDEIIFDSSLGGMWSEGTYEYRYYVKDNLGNYSNSGYSTYNFIPGVNAHYSKFVFKNVAPKVSLSLFTTGKISEESTEVEFLASFSDPSYINGLHSPIDPENDDNFLPPADDAAWYITIDYGDGTKFNYFDNDKLKMWRPGDIDIPNHIYKKNGTYHVTVTVSESSEGGKLVEQGSAQLDVNVVDNPPIVYIIPGIAEGTLFAYLIGGNAPYTFNWGGDCSGRSQSTIFPSLPGKYSCSITVTDGDGDISINEFSFAVNGFSMTPISSIQAPSITPEAASTSKSNVLGVDVIANENTNSFSIEANSGNTVVLQTNSGMCKSFNGLSFKTISGIKGKIFIYQHNKDSYSTIPMGNKNLTYDICEIVVDGFSSSDISDIKLQAKYDKSWLKKNKLNGENLGIYTSPGKDQEFSNKIKLMSIKGSGEFDVAEVELQSLPLVYALATSPEKEKQNFNFDFSWWMLGASGLVALGANGIWWWRRKVKN